MHPKDCENYHSRSMFTVPRIKDLSPIICFNVSRAPQVAPKEYCLDLTSRFCRRSKQQYLQKKGSLRMNGFASVGRPRFGKK